MSLKTGEAKLGFLKLFPAGTGKKPKEGEAAPGEAAKAGCAAAGVLAQQAPAGATAPLGLRMPQLLRDPQAGPRLPAAPTPAAAAAAEIGRAHV